MAQTYETESGNFKFTEFNKRVRGGLVITRYPNEGIYIEKEALLIPRSFDAGKLALSVIQLLNETRLPEELVQIPLQQLLIVNNLNCLVRVDFPEDKSNRYRFNFIAPRTLQILREELWQAGR